MNAVAIQQHQRDLDAFSKPSGYIEYETRTNLRDLITLYGFEGARSIVSEIFTDEKRRRSI